MTDNINNQIEYARLEKYASICMAAWWESNRVEAEIKLAKYRSKINGHLVLYYIRRFIRRKQCRGDEWQHELNMTWLSDCDQSKKSYLYNYHKWAGIYRNLMRGRR